MTKYLYLIEKYCEEVSSYDVIAVYPDPKLALGRAQQECASILVWDIKDNVAEATIPYVFLEIFMAEYIDE